MYCLLIPRKEYFLNRSQNGLVQLIQRQPIRTLVPHALILSNWIRRAALLPLDVQLVGRSFPGFKISFIAAYLLEAGADISATSVHESTAIQEAIYRTSQETFNVLMQQSLILRPTVYPAEARS